MNMERIDLINDEDLDEQKMRYWLFQYLGDRMAQSLAKGTLKQIKDSVYLASTLVATELTQNDYDEQLASHRKWEADHDQD